MNCARSFRDVGTKHMKILIFLAHPAHFHLFKHVIRALNTEKHQLLILIKQKDILEDLIKNEGFAYRNIQPVANMKRKRNRVSILALSAFDLLVRDMRLFKIAKTFKPDLMVGSEASIAHVGFVLGIPSVITNEDDLAVQPEFCYPTFPFVSQVLSPVPCNLGRWNNKKIGYEGYHKLAYLHPNYFTPSRDIVRRFHSGDEPYFILRFVSLTASHDVDISGLNYEIARNIIGLLEPHGKVYISAEREIEPEFEKYKLCIVPNDIHHALYYAHLLIGDSQSMAVEAAMLGTPSIRFSDFAGRINVLEELEHKYGLTFGIKTSEPDRLYAKIRELLSQDNLKEEWNRRRAKMLMDKIDVTAFMVWFIENYPGSVDVMQKNPQYQFCFR